MDSGRVGKALGIGTRVFSKAVVHAMEQSTDKAAERAVNAAARVQSAPPVHPASVNAQQVVANSRDVMRGVKQAGGGFFGNLRRFSGVVWLESMGVLFAIVTLYFAQSLWKARADFTHPLSQIITDKSLIVPAVAAVLFGYFTVTSFVRAEQRAQGKK